MSALDDMRAKVAEAKPDKPGRKKVWVQPEFADFAEGTVLAFDQTLTKTGWSLIEIDHSRATMRIRIHAGGVIQPPRPKAKGFEETFAKAESMAVGVERIMKRYWDRVDHVVHEMPSVAGYRIESSLMAAREIRRINADLQMPLGLTMLSRQAAYATLTGAPSTEKRQMTEAVNRLIPNYCRNTERWTQDVHDSVGLALKYLYDKKERP